MKPVVYAAVACAGLMGCAGAGGSPQRMASASPVGACVLDANGNVVVRGSAQAGQDAVPCKDPEARREAYLEDYRHRPRWPLQFVAPG